MLEEVTEWGRSNGWHQMGAMCRDNQEAKICSRGVAPDPIKGIKNFSMINKTKF
jgi:hypothetical protein